MKSKFLLIFSLLPPFFSKACFLPKMAEAKEKFIFYFLKNYFSLDLYHNCVNLSNIKRAEFISALAPKRRLILLLPHSCQ
jgi:hypothetical protein